MEGELETLHGAILMGARAAAVLLLPEGVVSCGIAVLRGSDRAADWASVPMPSAVTAILVYWALIQATGSAVLVGFVSAAFAWWAAFATAKRLRDKR